jgi:uncharacterized membrane protein
MIGSYLITIFLGFWLLIAPSTFGYSQHVLSYSDHATGFIFIICLFAFSKKGALAPWIVCLGGIWLQFAPLIFWAKDQVIYLNDTMIGILAIAFSVIIPKFLNTDKDEIPTGFSHNPSAWKFRIPIIALACLSWFISRYLASYQLGYIDHVWDPVFGDGTKLVITSKISKSFPVPDAGLGAMAYTLEALLGCMGGKSRWRSMPWAAASFAFLVVPVGICSIILIILQPVIVGAWCLLCLITALSMLIMVILAFSEMRAVISFLYQSVKTGKPFWQTFWHGS